jgi:WD40 repeat protein
VAGFSPDGRFLVLVNTRNADKAAQASLVDLVSRKQVGEPISGSNYAFSPSGKSLAFVRNNQVLLWKMGAQPSPLPDLPGYPGLISGLVFGRDEKLLAVYGSAGVALYDLQSGSQVGEPLGPAGQVSLMKFSPDGKFLGSISSDGIMVSDLATRTKRSGPFPGTGFVFSPDGQKLAIANGDGTTSLRDLAGPALLFDSLSGVNVAFSPDNRTFAIYDGSGLINFWDMERLAKTGRIVVRQDRCGADCVRLAFSPDGKTLAYSTGAEIILWNVELQQRSAEPIPVSSVNGLAFIYNGQFLAWTDVTGHTIFWDLTASAPFGSSVLGSLHLDGINPATQTFLFDNENVWSLWEFDFENWVAGLCARAGRNFSQAEWEQYFSGEPYRLTCPGWPPG